MSYKNNKQTYSATNLNSSSNSILFWLVSCFSIIFLFWAPFQKGLFNGNTFDFERPLFSAFVWVSIVLFLISIYFFVVYSFNSVADKFAMLIWLLPLTYLVSSLNAASANSAINMLLIQLIYVAFFTITMYLTNTTLGTNIIHYGFTTSTYFIVIFGLFNWFGNKEIAFSLIKWFSATMNSGKIYQDAIMSDSNGIRLTSIFQYANSYAAFLIAILLSSIFLTLSSKKWFSAAIHGFMGVPIIISFFLTLSRGGLVILPIVLLLILFFLKPSKQLLYLIHLLVSFCLSLIILTKVTNIGIQLDKAFDAKLSLTGWTIIIIVAIINSLLAICIQRYAASWIEKKLDNFNQKRHSSIAIPLTFVVIGILGLFVLFNDIGLTKVLPENIRVRIENINFQQHSVLERGTFYKDGLKLFNNYPLLGAGGGAWSTLYEKYQNNPYVSRQAHNFFLQYLLEVGIIGFAIFLGIVIAIFYLYIKNFSKILELDKRPIHFVYLITSISLLIHSMIDFDLSFVYLGVILFLSLGFMVSVISKASKKDSKQTANQKIKWIFPSLLLIISIVSFFYSAQLLNANSNFRAAQAAVQSQKATINDILTPLNKALKQHPNHPDYASFKADILLQAYEQSKDERFYNDAVSLINQTREKEPYNRYLIERELSTLTVKNQLTKAYDLINNEINNFPWDITLYEKSITLAFSLGDQARNNKNTNQMNQYWDQSFAMYNKILEKNKVLEALPKEQQQGRAFGLTKPMAFSLGQIDFIRGKYSEAEIFLNFQINDQFDDQMNKQMVRWYLAALQKQNKNDQALYDKLISKDPKEQEEINKLVSATF